MTAADVLAALTERGITAEERLPGYVFIDTPTGSVQVSDYSGGSIGTDVGFYVGRYGPNNDALPDDEDEGYVYASNVDDPAFVDGSDFAEMIAAVYAEVDPLRAAFFAALAVSVEEDDPRLIADALSSLLIAVGKSDPARFIDR